ncbi:MAG: S1 RNA-binding domain-containing protein [Kiritimatiellae bacterium]|jgi:small subunit ribosomal protein S1|nr:S1 RNA-binding domain-containing protein [Kiritimatiellia bacterium]
MKKASMADFEALLNAQFESFRKGFDPGERVRARIAAITPTNVILDVNAKKEGILPLTSLEKGAEGLKAGDSIDVVFVGLVDGALVFATGAADATGGADRSVLQAFEAKLPIDGKVQSEVNGGYEVMVGKTRGFCPYSQIALHREEGASYIGKTFAFLVEEYDPEEKNLIVSRRALLERQAAERREALKATLVEGETRTGKVTRIADFGFFVDLGGAEGLVPLRELSWDRGVKPADIAKPGDEVEVLVRTIDWEANRISLSLRALQANPMDAFIAAAQVGAQMTGKITRIEQFGAFVQLEPGVEGLLPTGAIARGRRIGHPSQLVSVGQSVEVRIDSIEPDRKRISLRLVPTAEEIAAAEKERAEREARRRKAMGVSAEEAEAEEPFDLGAALDDFRKEQGDGGSFGSLGDAFSGIGI